MKTIRALMEISTLVSLYVSGIMGIFIIGRLGPWLAMGAQMYAGNTEPREPHLPWPVFVTVLTAALPIWPITKKRWTLATIAAIPFFAVPFWQLTRLYAIAGQP
jgi:hypothetical protein